MKSPRVYTMKSTDSSGTYQVRDGYKDHGVFRIGYGDLESFENEVYDWTQTGVLDDKELAIPDGSLIRVDRPSLVIYMYQAWPTAICGKDMSKVKNIHLFKS
jgi:hypothetical protein